MDKNRFERQIGLFGEEGQARIREAHVAVVGVGGTGSHVVQQLAFLGVGHFNLIDPDELEVNNLNRLVGASDGDPKGTKKVDIAVRQIKFIDSTIEVNAVAKSLRTEEAFSAIRQSNYVFGCIDNDETRLVLNELCVAYEIPYFDIASEVSNENGLVYGGRVFVNFDNNGCLHCYDEISRSSDGVKTGSSKAKKDIEDIYGVSAEYLGGTGPSVISINGVVASLAVAEFMVMITGLRDPNRFIQYYGNRNKRIVCTREELAISDCYYCKVVRGQRENANVERYYKRT